MKALIFAAGRGVRMMPLTADTPKPMLEVLGKPLLAHIIESLPPEITELVVLVGYKGEVIRDYLGGEFQGKKVSYVEQGEPLGTGHALYACREHVSEGERFLLIYADDLHDAAAMARGVKNGKRLLFVAKVQYPERFGIVTTDESGRATAFEEAPKDVRVGMAWTGVAILDSDVFKYEPYLDPQRGEQIIQTMVVPYMRDKEVFLEEEATWTPVGVPDDLKKAEKVLLEQGKG